MRVVFIGAGELSLSTARILIKRGYEVVIIEQEREKIDELSDEMDCGFIHGDGSKPAILREVGPKQTDVLFCLTKNDQDNIIAGLVGRSQGFHRVVPSIRDEEFQTICNELGLKDTISPTGTISRYLADMLTGIDFLELSTIIKDEARFFSFTVDKQQEGSIEDLDLPEEAKAVCYYREGNFNIIEGEYTLKADDEVVILTHSKNLSTLQKRFFPKDEQQE